MAIIQQDSHKGLQPSGKASPHVVGRHVIAVPILASDDLHKAHLAKVAAAEAKAEAEAAEKAKAEEAAKVEQAVEVAAAPVLSKRGEK